MLFETPCTFHILLLLSIYCSFILLCYGIFYFSTKFRAKTIHEEEYLWSYKFSGAGKEYSWCLEDRADQDEEDAADPSVKPGHRLLLKFAVLMHRAKAGEESAVQVESEGYNNCKV